MTTLADLLEAQLKLQIEHMKDGDPRTLTGDAMADFMRWNAFALTDEVHEAMAEVGWKPWATNRAIDEEAFLGEMVDGFHFFMNMLLCGVRRPPEVIAQKFEEAYFRKNQRNAERQQEGYSGLDKCPGCHRDLTDTKRTMASYEAPDGSGHWCSKGCHMSYYPGKYNIKEEFIG